MNKISLPFDPQDEIFRWGPIPGKFLYASHFTEVHLGIFEKKYNENWPETIFLLKNGQYLWLNRAKDLEKAGRRVFIRYLFPKSKRKKIYSQWLMIISLLNELYKKIELQNLSQVSNLTLLKLWNEFNNLYIKFWTTGSIPELANYGSISYLEEKLQAYFASEDERTRALEILTAPTYLSFYQEEEVDLSKTANLIEHQKKYFWLKNSYAGTNVLTVSFFRNRKKSLPNNLATEISKKLKLAIQRKRELEGRYRLPKELLDISEAISDGISWQDERKKNIFIALHYINLMAKEIARRFGYKVIDLKFLWSFEITQIIKGKNLHKKIKKREKGLGFQFFRTCKEFSSDETNLIWHSYEVKNIDQEQTYLKGIVVSRGNGRKLTGRIHILLDPLKARTFKQGEILVAPMTSPEYIFAMRKASAILTDTGGLTSHAAIISRELGIPCIVGTKIATKVLKDGDLVEVDAEKGLITILN